MIELSIGDVVPHRIAELCLIPITSTCVMRVRRAHASRLQHKAHSFSSHHKHP